MFDPITIGVGVLVWLAFKKQSGTQFGAVTPEREELYQNAMAYCADPEKLRGLAREFQKEGLRAQADLLNKRADWRGRSAEEKQGHAEIFDRAMKSQNVQAILDVASAFEGMTASKKAEQLRAHAQAVNEEKLKPVEVPVDPKKTNGVHVERAEAAAE